MSTSRRKLILAIAIVFALNIVIILIVQTLSRADAATYRQGSTGSTVKTIQTKLKNWGYYKGGIDGIYGSKTVEAVKYFQRKNGLTADGICGAKTLAALGINEKSSTSSSARSNDLELLARIISAEARGEPYNGQVAVGAVVMNRIKHPSFPNTLAGVIYQPGAFTAVTDGQVNKPIADASRNAAVDAMNGWDPTGGCVYYYNPAKTTNKWMLSKPVSVTIGKHKFCK